MPKKMIALTLVLIYLGTQVRPAFALSPRWQVSSSDFTRSTPKILNATSALTTGAVRQQFTTDNFPRRTAISLERSPFVHLFQRVLRLFTTPISDKLVTSGMNALAGWTFEQDVRFSSLLTPVPSQALGFWDVVILALPVLVGFVCFILAALSNSGLFDGLKAVKRYGQRAIKKVIVLRERLAGHQQESDIAQYFDETNGDWLAQLTTNDRRYIHRILNLDVTLFEQPTAWQDKIAKRFAGKGASGQEKVYVCAFEKAQGQSQSGTLYLRLDAPLEVAGNTVTVLRFEGVRPKIEDGSIQAYLPPERQHMEDYRQRRIVTNREGNVMGQNFPRKPWGTLPSHEAKMAYDDMLFAAESEAFASDTGLGWGKLKELSFDKSDVGFFVAGMTEEDRRLQFNGRDPATITDLSTGAQEALTAQAGRGFFFDVGQMLRAYHKSGRFDARLLDQLGVVRGTEGLLPELRRLGQAFSVRGDDKWMSIEQEAAYRFLDFTPLFMQLEAGLSKEIAQALIEGYFGSSHGDATRVAAGTVNEGFGLLSILLGEIESENVSVPWCDLQPELEDFCDAILKAVFQDRLHRRTGVRSVGVSDTTVITLSRPQNDHLDLDVLGNFYYRKISSLYSIEEGFSEFDDRGNLIGWKGRLNFNQNEYPMTVKLIGLQVQLSLFKPGGSYQKEDCLATGSWCRGNVPVLQLMQIAQRRDADLSMERELYFILFRLMLKDLSSSASKVEALSVEDVSLLKGWMPGLMSTAKFEMLDAFGFVPSSSAKYLAVPLEPRMQEFQNPARAPFATLRLNNKPDFLILTSSGVLEQRVKGIYQNLASNARAVLDIVLNAGSGNPRQVIDGVGYHAWLSGNYALDPRFKEWLKKAAEKEPAQPWHRQAVDLSLMNHKGVDATYELISDFVSQGFIEALSTTIRYPEREIQHHVKVLFEGLKAAKSSEEQEQNYTASLHALVETAIEVCRGTSKWLFLCDDLPLVLGAITGRLRDQMSVTLLLDGKPLTFGLEFSIDDEMNLAWKARALRINEEFKDAVGKEPASQQGDVANTLRLNTHWMANTYVAKVFLSDFLASLGKEEDVECYLDENHPKGKVLAAIPVSEFALDRLKNILFFASANAKRLGGLRFDQEIIDTMLKMRFFLMIDRTAAETVIQFLTGKNFSHEVEDINNIGITALANATGWQVGAFYEKNELVIEVNMPALALEEGTGLWASNVIEPDLENEIDPVMMAEASLRAAMRDFILRHLYGQVPKKDRGDGLVEFFYISQVRKEAMPEKPFLKAIVRAHQEMCVALTKGLEHKISDDQRRQRLIQLEVLFDVLTEGIEALNSFSDEEHTRAQMNLRRFRALTAINCEELNALMCKPEQASQWAMIALEDLECRQLHATTALPADESSMIMRIMRKYSDKVDDVNAQIKSTSPQITGGIEMEFILYADDHHLAEYQLSKQSVNEIVNKMNNLLREKLPEVPVEFEIDNLFVVELKSPLILLSKSDNTRLSWVLVNWQDVILNKVIPLLNKELPDALISVIGEGRKYKVVFSNTHFNLGEDEQIEVNNVMPIVSLILLAFMNQRTPLSDENPHHLVRSKQFMAIESSSGLNYREGRIELLMGYLWKRGETMTMGSPQKMDEKFVDPRVAVLGASLALVSWYQKGGNAIRENALLQRLAGFDRQALQLLFKQLNDGKGNLDAPLNCLGGKSFREALKAVILNESFKAHFLECHGQQVEYEYLSALVTKENGKLPELTEPRFYDVSGLQDHESAALPPFYFVRNEMGNNGYEVRVVETMPNAQRHDMMSEATRWELEHHSTAIGVKLHLPFEYGMSIELPLSEVDAIRKAQQLVRMAEEDVPDFSSREELYEYLGLAAPVEPTLLDRQIYLAA